MHVNVYGKSPHLEKWNTNGDGWHQDDSSVIRLLFKMLFLPGLIDPSTVIPTSDDECITCVIFVNDANCTGSLHKHHAVAKDHQSLTIVLDTSIQL